MAHYGLVMVHGVNTCSRQCTHTVNANAPVLATCVRALLIAVSNAICEEQHLAGCFCARLAEKTRTMASSVSQAEGVDGQENGSARVLAGLDGLGSHVLIHPASSIQGTVVLWPEE
jgi:hypothetical protein